MTCRAGRLAKRVHRDDAGFSLVELLIVMLVLTVLLIAILNLLDTTSGEAAKDNERGIALTEAQQGLHRMTLELRRAYRFNSASHNTLDVLIRCRRDETGCTAGGTSGEPFATQRSKRVVFNCNAPFAGAVGNASAALLATYRSCTRTEYKTPLAGGACCDASAAPSAQKLLIERILNHNVSTCPLPSTDSNAVPPPFVFRDKNGTQQCTFNPIGATVPVGTNATAQIDVTLRAPTAGSRLQGYPNEFQLRDGVMLRNRTL